MSVRVGEKKKEKETVRQKHVRQSVRHSKTEGRDGNTHCHGLKQSE